MINFIKSLFCKHLTLEFKENLSGDIINHYDCRSLWICKKCKEIIKIQTLHKKD